MQQRHVIGGVLVASNKAFTIFTTQYNQCMLGYVCMARGGRRCGKVPVGCWATKRPLSMGSNQQTCMCTFDNKQTRARAYLGHTTPWRGCRPRTGTPENQRACNPPGASHCPRRPARSPRWGHRLARSRRAASAPRAPARLRAPDLGTQAACTYI
jgi:hypothetical protein